MYPDTFSKVLFVTTFGATLWSLFLSGLTAKQRRSQFNFNNRTQVNKPKDILKALWLKA